MSEEELQKLAEKWSDTIVDKCLNLRARHEDEVWNNARCENVLLAAFAQVHAAGAAEERARVVALLEKAKRAARDGRNAARRDGLDNIASEEGANEQLCDLLLSQVRNP